MQAEVRPRGLAAAKLRHSPNTSTESSKKTRSRVVYEDSVEVCGGWRCALGRRAHAVQARPGQHPGPAYMSMATMTLVRAAMTHAVTNM